jgi:hypothetical protein
MKSASRILHESFIHQALWAALTQRPGFAASTLCHISMQRTFLSATLSMQDTSAAAAPQEDQHV